MKSDTGLNTPSRQLDDFLSVFDGFAAFDAGAHWYRRCCKAVYADSCAEIRLERMSVGVP